MRAFFTICVVSLFLLAAAGVYALQDHLTPNDLTTPANVMIAKKTSALQIAKQLANQKVIRHPHTFFLVNYLTQNSRRFKAGEYEFAPGMTPADVAAQLARGDVVIHKITLPEGWNVQQVKEVLLADPILKGEITIPMIEGWLLPETYHYTRGDTRDQVVRRMQKAMDEVIADRWKNRAAGLPLANAQEAIILASIVEKETGVPEERGRVAAVFINRLRKGMPLQTDPTVIYGIEHASGKPMGRELTRKDLQTPSAYNTYLIPGLPPTPIANPGIDSIEAVLHPPQTDELYFVATGNGGHRFAKTLEEHNRNVAAYRAALKR